MPEWLQVLLWASAGVTAVGVLYKGAWKGFLQPILKAAKLQIKTLPGIAKEFEPNAGKSLADRVRRIDDAVAEITKEAQRAKVEAEAAKWMAEKAARGAEDTKNVMTDRLAQMAGGQFLIVQRLEAIEARSHRVRATDPIQATEVNVQGENVNVKEKE